MMSCYVPLCAFHWLLFYLPWHKCGKVSSRFQLSLFAHPAVHIMAVDIYISACVPYYMEAQTWSLRPQSSSKYKRITLPAGTT
ncbi:hypothetical protein BJX61DRAFT_511927 [Aspergillus egyptiacus]|nr:hypothetical protein BJX61DRAFT_511927 [Aspergillus egyptiacus]